MWVLLGPGIEPVSPALAYGFFITEPPGKPCTQYFLHVYLFIFSWRIIALKCCIVVLLFSPSLCDPMNLDSLSFTISLSLLISTESVMLFNHLILCHPLFLLPSIFPSIGVFSSESALCIKGQNTGASASVLSVTFQGCFPLELTGLISFLSKGFSRVFSSTTIHKQQFFGAQPSLWYSTNITHQYQQHGQS